MIIEKHWRGLTSRNVCDFFMEEVNKYKEREDVPPIITTSKYYLVSVFRDDLFVLAVVTNEVSGCCSYLLLLLPMRICGVTSHTTLSLRSLI